MISKRDPGPEQRRALGLRRSSGMSAFRPRCENHLFPCISRTFGNVSWKRYYVQSKLIGFRENDQSDKRLDWEIIVFPERDSSCSEMYINPLQNSTFWKSETASRKRYYMQSNWMEFRESDHSDKRLNWEIIVFPEHDSSCLQMSINPLQNSIFWKSETVSRKRLFFST